MNVRKCVTLVTGGRVRLVWRRVPATASTERPDGSTPTPAEPALRVRGKLSVPAVREVRDLGRDIWFDSHLQRAATFSHTRPSTRRYSPADATRRLRFLSIL